jgi:hypothetical protein
VIARLLPPTYLPINIGGFKLSGDGGAKQQMINAQSRIPAISVPEIITECVDVLPGMERAKGIGPALGDEKSIGFARPCCSEVSGVE